jgi:hypothetical protein
MQAQKEHDIPIQNSMLLPIEYSNPMKLPNAATAML